MFPALNFFTFYHFKVSFFYGWVWLARLLWPKRRSSEQKYFSRNSIVDLLKRRENTLSLFGAYENFLVKFYYCQKVKIEKCYRVRTAGRQNYRFYRDLKWNTR